VLGFTPALGQSGVATTCVEQFFILMINLLSSIFLWQNKKKVGNMYAVEKMKKIRVLE
jgi:hypothetical protein